jgi:hypothetical protein
VDTQTAWMISVISAIVGALAGILIERAILWWIRINERPKLTITEQWITKKGARDDNGKPFVFIITGIGIKNENSLWHFQRDTAEISETRIVVLDKDGNLAIGGSKLGRWWNYEFADSDPLFPKSNVIPQEESTWIYIPQAVEKRLVIGYWIKETNSFYIYTTSSHKKNRWAKREEKIKGNFPFFIRVEIKGKNFIETKRFIFLNKNGDFEIKETSFPFNEKI